MSVNYRSLLAVVVLVLTVGGAVETLDPKVANSITTSFIVMAVGIVVAFEIKFSIFSYFFGVLKSWRGVKIQLW